MPRRSSNKADRLRTILERMNRTFARRKIEGRPVRYLLRRAGPLTNAWLALRSL